jgi:hypothetical protein
VNHAVAIRTKRYKVGFGVEAIFFAHTRNRYPMMNFDVLFTYGSINLFKVQSATEAAVSMVEETSRSVLGASLINILHHGNFLPLKLT